MKIANDNSYGRCMYCGKQLGTSGLCDCSQSKLLNSDIQHSPLDKQLPEYIPPQLFKFAYCCPNCDGRFNIVVCVQENGAPLFYRCPFCDFP